MRCCRKGENTTTMTILYISQVEWKQCGGGNGDEAPLREVEAVTIRATAR
jgi:hypothetical protein